MQLRIGDLVLCRDTHYNRGLDIVEAVGMVAELRRKDVRILFDVDNQSIWLPRTSVSRITLPPTDTPSLLDRLSWLIHFVEASACELELEPSGHYRATVLCGPLTLERIHEVRRYMEPVLIRVLLIPRGMSRLGLELVFERKRNGKGTPG